MSFHMVSKNKLIYEKTTYISCYFRDLSVNLIVYFVIVAVRQLYCLFKQQCRGLGAPTIVATLGLPSISTNYHPYI